MTRRVHTSPGLCARPARAPEPGPLGSPLAPLQPTGSDPSRRSIFLTETRSTGRKVSLPCPARPSPSVPGGGDSLSLTMTWLAGGHAHSAAAAASTGHRTRLRLHPARLPAPDAVAPGPRTAEPGVSPDGTRWPVPCARGRGSSATCHCRVIPASVQVQRPVSTPRPGPCQTRRLSRLGGREGGTEDRAERHP